MGVASQQLFQGRVQGRDDLGIGARGKDSQNGGRARAYRCKGTKYEVRRGSALVAAMN